MIHNVPPLEPQSEILISEYSEKIEDLKANKTEQDRLANLITALASAIPVLNTDAMTYSKSKERLNKETNKLLGLLNEEDSLLARLETLRKEKKF